MCEKKDTYIHVIRHGITEGNQRRLYYGSSDIPLAPEGKEKLSQLVMEGIYPDGNDAVIYTSGMLRTEQTKQIIFGEKEHCVLDEFREFDFGELEMKTHNEVVKHDEYEAWVGDESGKTASPGGESMHEFKKRVCNKFEDLLEEYRSGAEARDTIVVCHGGVIAMIMEKHFPGEQDHVFKWILDPGHGYSIKINSESGQPVSYISF